MLHYLNWQTPGPVGDTGTPKILQGEFSNICKAAKLFQPWQYIVYQVASGLPCALVSADKNVLQSFFIHEHVGTFLIGFDAFGDWQPVLDGQLFYGEAIEGGENDSDTVSFTGQLSTTVDLTLCHSRGPVYRVPQQLGGPRAGNNSTAGSMQFRTDSQEAFVTRYMLVTKLFFSQHNSKNRRREGFF